MKFKRSTSSATTDNRLDFLDQASFLRLRATGVETVAQATWVYDRAVDMDNLRRFNQNLGRGLLGRRVERSPLPFGRHRWVAYHEAPEIDIASSPRPRADIGAWMDERAQIRVDPEYGPCWHLGVLPLEDGGTAVSVVASHTLADGVGGSLVMYEAVVGAARELGYPPPQSRTRLRALFVDLRDTLRGLPQVVGALIACVLMLFRRSHDMASQFALPSRSASQPGPDEAIVLPAVSLLFDLTSWDARARDLGGTSSSLFIAFATRLAELMGRISPTDGSVTISVPVSERTLDDTRGNALTGITLRLDSARAKADLQYIRNEMKQGLANLHQTPNEDLKVLPLVPFAPKWLARKAEGLALNNPDLPVGCSNVRDLDPVVTRIDGADAVVFCGRTINQGTTRRTIESAGGQLYLVSGRVNGKIFITVSAYQLGAENSKKYLRGLIEQALADYRLSAAIDI